ncbi:MAG: protein kinase, partial [Lentisphaeraceae bacterium]|nr:protein kinase [Lentisphaeraceae bacterium]
EKAVLIDYGTVLTPDSNLTQDCSLLGTPNYMAPECFSDSHEISYKADYFSLGAIIYLYAYGKTPYSGKDVYATLKNILSIREEDLFKGSIFDPLLKKLVVKAANSRFNNIESIKKELLAVEE